MFRFGCSSAYGPHSYSAQVEPAHLGSHGNSIEFRSFLHAEQGRYGGIPSFPSAPVKRIYQLIPGVTADEAFDVFVFLIALAIVLAGALGTCFFIAWFANLKGTAIQERGAYGIPVTQSAAQDTWTTASPAPMRVVASTQQTVNPPPTGIGRPRVAGAGMFGVNQY
jgi:hypothetical protein